MRALLIAECLGEYVTLYDEGLVKQDLQATLKKFRRECRQSGIEPVLQVTPLEFILRVGVEWNGPIFPPTFAEYLEQLKEETEDGQETV